MSCAFKWKGAPTWGPAAEAAAILCLSSQKVVVSYTLRSLWIRDLLLRLEGASVAMAKPALLFADGRKEPSELAVSRLLQFSFPILKFPKERAG